MSKLLTKNAQAILERRYLYNGETVDSLWDRVSGGDARYRQLLSDLLFLPNSPTLFNAGTPHAGTLSACFVFSVADSLLDGPDSIHATRGKALAVAKAGGGVGYYFGNLRPKNSLIRSVHRKACGPVAVLRDYHAIRALVSQGGKRDLAQMGVLNCDHPDIVEFVHAKDADPKSLESFNISVGWHDAAVAASGAGPYRQLWDTQVNSAWSHGCPGMLFPDRINNVQGNPNPHLGRINAVNPCGETPNRNDEPCNLGSVVVSRCYDAGNRTVDWKRLEEVVWKGTFFLDDILDRNTFPHQSITNAALLTRKLGLGVMGWADLLAKLQIYYDTPEAVELGGKLMKFVAEVSLAASTQLAREKGPYGGYSDRTQGPQCRNETRTSIAPTGTIAIIAGCDSWSIEPHFGLDVERTTNEGLKLHEKYCEEKYDGFVPHVASDIPWQFHVRHQAAFQAHTDLGVSKTINLPNTATRDDVSAAYRLMHELHCKGGTVFRDGCRAEQVLVKKESSVYALGGVPARRKLPRECRAWRKKFKIGGVAGYIHTGVHEDGTLGEVFVTVNVGSTVDGLLDAWSKAFSLAVQHGTPLEQLVKLNKNTRFEPCGLTGDKELPTCTSIPDYVVRYLEQKFLGAPRKQEEGNSGAYCPDCQRELVYAGGCLNCPDATCGYSRCG